MSHFFSGLQVPYRPLRRLSLLTICWALVVGGWQSGQFLVGSANAQEDERPRTEDLLPETTVLFFQIRDFRDLMVKLQESNIGLMLQDERIAPLVAELYQQGLEAYSEIQEEVGLTMEEIESLPSGEICFAVVAPKRKEPEVVLIIDTDPENEAVEKTLERVRNPWQNPAQPAKPADGEGEGGEADDPEGDAVSLTTEDADDEDSDDDEFEVLKIDGNSVRMFRRNGTIILSTSRKVLADIRNRWDGVPVKKIRPLSQNRKFVTIMNRCRGTREMEPEIRGFVDPIAFAKSATRGNMGAQVAINMLPVLGLDGLLGIGGSVLYQEQEFESVFHGHLLLANPRKGIFEMISLKPDEYQPQPWIPADISTYMTTSWDIPTMFNELEKIVDLATSEGTFRKGLEQANEEVGIDIEQDVIQLLSGRITYAQWIVQPYRLNSASNIVAIEVNDVEKAEQLLEKLMARIQEEDQGSVELKTYKGQDYWQLADDRADRQRERRQNSGVEIDLRITQPAVTVIGQHIILCDHTATLKRVIDTDRGETPALVDDEEFHTVAQKMTRLLGSDLPSALIYSRPAETLRMWFEVAKGSNARSLLEDAAADNRYAAGVLHALEDNPLPEFDEIQHYFPPQGSFITDDETGYHILTFNLKARVPEAAGER